MSLSQKIRRNCLVVSIRTILYRSSQPWGNTKTLFSHNVLRPCVSMFHMPVNLDARARILSLPLLPLTNIFNPWSPIEFSPLNVHTIFSDSTSQVFHRKYCSTSLSSLSPSTSIPSSLDPQHMLPLLLLVLLPSWRSRCAISKPTWPWSRDCWRSGGVGGSHARVLIGICCDVRDELLRSQSEEPCKREGSRSGIDTGQEEVMRCYCVWYLVELVNLDNRKAWRLRTFEQSIRRLTIGA